MKYPPESFKYRAHALVHSLSDTATWRDLIDSAIERMDLDAESRASHAAAMKELESRDTSEYDA